MAKSKPKTDEPKEPQREAKRVGDLSDQAVEALKRERFQQRVQRVLEVMQRERVDWRGIAYIAPDGRVGARVLPVEMERP